LDEAQMTLNTTLNGAAETAVVVTAPIPSDTPTTGTIRVQLDTGINRYLTYTSYTGSTFTIPSTSFTGANAATTPRNVFVTYIDKLAGASTESFTTVFSSTRDLIVFARDGGVTPIKPFTGDAAQLIATGGSQAVVRTSDA
jgi:hypothetical protein